MIKLGIKSIKYRASDKDIWRELKIVSLSAELSEEWTNSQGGKYSTVKVTANIRNSSKQNDITMQYLSEWFWTYQITDMNGRTYVFGSDDFRARFTYTRNFGQLNANGYSINIEYKSPEGINASY